MSLINQKPFVVGGLGFEFCVFVAGWRHALRSEWPFIINIINQKPVTPQAPHARPQASHETSQMQWFRVWSGSGFRVWGLQQGFGRGRGLVLLWGFRVCPCRERSLLPRALLWRLGFCCLALRGDGEGGRGRGRGRGRGLAHCSSKVGRWWPCAALLTQY